jgi:hypothetical protein
VQPIMVNHESYDAPLQNNPGARDENATDLLLGELQLKNTSP